MFNQEVTVTYQALELCPFCGSDNVAIFVKEYPTTKEVKKDSITTIINEKDILYQVVCMECFCGSGKSELREPVIKAWNERVACGKCPKKP